MIYSIKFTKGSARVDTDKIAKRFVCGGQQFVRFFEKGDRLRFIEFLESEGFYCAEDRGNSRKNTIDSIFPLVIDMDAKRIYHMGNATCSAAASGAGLIMSDRDFYLLYSLSRIQQGCESEKRNSKNV